MALVTGLITLGIGPDSGANILHSLTFGLNAAPPVIFPGYASLGVMQYRDVALVPKELHTQYRSFTIGGPKG